MIVRFIVEVPHSGNKDPYTLTLEQLVEPRDLEQSIAKVADLPEAARKFVEESIRALSLELLEQKQIKDEKASQDEEE